MTGEKIRLFPFVAVLFLSSCKNEFNPPAVTSSLNYLVVDGFINAGNAATNFKLSRTINLVDTVTYKPERGAMMDIEGDDGFISYLQEDSAGNYSGGPYNLSGNSHYRVRIKTKGGPVYLSDPVSVNSTPPIDSIGWERNKDGVLIYANTHDQLNNSRYYHWRYTQTWKFHSAYQSSLEYKNGVLVARLNYDSLYTCWHTEESNALVLGTSALLSENVIYQQPLISIPENSWQISDKYTILVQQEAIDEGAFKYMQALKKNTEQTGTVFDPQPSTINGNIHCISDATQIAIGYIYASSVTEKRIFIDNSELPGWRYQTGCYTFYAETSSDFQFVIAGYYIPIALNNMGLLLTTAFCGNCTLRGTHQKPGFWP